MARTKIRDQVPPVAAVVLSYNRRTDLLLTLEQLQADSYPNLQILVIDNGSSDGTLEGIPERFEEVRLLRLPYNIGTRARDFAVTVTDSKYIVHFDDDSAPEADAISKMVEIFEGDPTIGVVPFNVIGGPYSGELPKTHPADLLGFINCGVGMRPQAIRDAGYLDPDFFVYAEEWDLGVRIRNAGWRFHFDPEVRVHHRTPDDARNLRFRRILAARNETWIVFKYYPVGRIPLLVLRVLFWNMLGARAEGPRSSPRYAVRGVLSACWGWRVAVSKRQAIDPDFLEALERRSGLWSLRPTGPRLGEMIRRRLRIPRGSTPPR